MNDNPVYGTSNATFIPDRLIVSLGLTEAKDVFTMSLNQGKAPHRGGNAVACLDSDGDGVYEILRATFTEGRRFHNTNIS